MRHPRIMAGEVFAAFEGTASTNWQIKDEMCTKRRMPVSGNSKSRLSMSPRRLAEVIAHTALTRPDSTALVFLADGERETERWSYAELDRRAHRVAQAL